MNDRTQLEKEIEHHERIITPASIKSIVVILVVSLCFLLVYAVKLKLDLRRIEHESAILKDTFIQEKGDLERQLKQLRSKPIPSNTK